MIGKIMTDSNRLLLLNTVVLFLHLFINFSVDGAH
jgi:hypothetical protein